MSKRIVKLTERDLQRIVKRVISEQPNPFDDIEKIACKKLIELYTSHMNTSGETNISTSSKTTMTKYVDKLDECKKHVNESDAKKIDEIKKWIKTL